MEAPSETSKRALPSAHNSKITPFPPRESGYAVLWGRQMAVMLKKNFVLLYLRYIKSTLLQIIAPLFFLLFLFVLQEGARSLDGVANPTPIAYELSGLPRCYGGHDGQNPCITLMYAPANDPAVEQVIDRLLLNDEKRGGTLKKHTSAYSTIEKPEETLDVVPVPSEAFLSNFITTFENVTTFGVVFNITGTAYRYQLWFNSTLTTNVTQGITDIYDVSLMQMMRGIDEAIINVAGSPTFELKTRLKDFPGLPTAGIADNIIVAAGPVFFFCCAMINFLSILNAIANEKEHKLRHGMEMMGLIPSVYWLSWFIVNLTIIIMSSLLTVAFGIAFRFPVFTNADFGAVFLLFFLFQVAMITFAFFLSTMVRKVRVAVLLGVFVLILGLIFMLAVFSSAFVGYIWWEDSTDDAGWIVLIFLPFFNFGKLYLDVATLANGRFDYGTDTLVLGPGFTWSSMYEIVPKEYWPPGSYQMAPPVHSIYYMIMNIALYSLLTWYLDNVVPDEFGQRRPLYFFATPSYWGYKRTKRTAKAYPPPPTVEAGEEDDDVHTERLNALDDEKSASKAIRLVGLNKVYRASMFFKNAKKDKIAVANSSWTLDEGQLLALLGQNGAGKTTTMNILCGFSRPTAGTAFLFGQDIRLDMAEIRKEMGVCPQHDILFSDLTAREHIELYAGIKNIDPKDIPQLTEERLEAVKLLKVADRNAGAYSGGMKRRLSVAISTIGEPRIVFMDEPTTGMDPVNRRYVWSFIEHFKQGRVIVLTTHSMEEADVLGDNIAIMALGKLRAFGTGIRLKNKFGAGYRLSLVVNGDHVEEIQADMKARIPNIIVEDDSAGALIFNIPPSSVDKLAALVAYLESGAAAHVKEWGISQTTLEEVFLRLIREINPTKR